MDIIDVIIVIVLLVGITLFGMAFKSKATKDVDSFIVGDRKLPFWLAALSNIATNLNSSTPLSDSRKIRNDGLSGQWFFWTSHISASIGTVWFTRLWRRSGITTAMEFYDIRYDGWAASSARVWNVMVIGLFNGTVWSALGLVGIKKIANVMFKLPETVYMAGFNVDTDWLVVIGVVALAFIYCSASGVLGVVWTDFIELIIVLVCSFTLAFLVYKDVGWGWGLRDKILNLGEDGKKLLSLAPGFGPAAIVLLVIQPLCSLGMYNPGVQRMLCVKSEKETLKSFTFGTFISYGLRPWPYLLVGLAGMFLLTDGELMQLFAPITASNGALVPDYEMVYPALVIRYLPTGLIGMMMASFLFAFMSSYDTNVHTNASIFVNDFYRPHLMKGKSTKHYIAAARWFMFVQTVASIFIAVYVNNILSMIIFALMIHNCAGALPLLRFVWWRINAKAELAALASGLIAVIFILATPWGKELVNATASVLGQTRNDSFYAIRYLYIIGTSTFAGLITLLFTKPEPMDKLVSFCKKVRPYGAWGPVRELCGEMPEKDPIGLLITLTICGILFGFGVIFTCIGLFLALWTMFAISLVICVSSIIIFMRATNKLYPGE